MLVVDSEFPGRFGALFARANLGSPPVLSQASKKKTWLQGSTPSYSSFLSDTLQVNTVFLKSKTHLAHLYKRTRPIWPICTGNLGNPPSFGPVTHLLAGDSVQQQQTCGSGELPARSPGLDPPGCGALGLEGPWGPEAQRPLSK